MREINYEMMLPYLKKNWNVQKLVITFLTLALVSGGQFSHPAKSVN